MTPLYRVDFEYNETWTVDAGERHRLLFAEGRCEGRIAGRFRGANRARQRADGTWLPDLHAVIETDDGLALASITHVTGDERYRWLNSSLCVGHGTVDLPRISLEVAEVPARYDQAS